MAKPAQYEHTFTSAQTAIIENADEALKNTRATLASYDDGLISRAEVIQRLVGDLLPVCGQKLLDLRLMGKRSVDRSSQVRGRSRPFRLEQANARRRHSELSKESQPSPAGFLRPLGYTGSIGNERRGPST